MHPVTGFQLTRQQLSSQGSRSVHWAAAAAHSLQTWLPTDWHWRTLDRHRQGCGSSRVHGFCMQACCMHGAGCAAEPLCCMRQGCLISRVTRARGPPVLAQGQSMHVPSAADAPGTAKSRTALNKEPTPPPRTPGQLAGCAGFPPPPQRPSAALLCRAQDWAQQQGQEAPRLREVIGWPSDQPWPAWADHLFPGGLCNTVNTMQFPSANVYNWCCAWALQHPHAAEVPVVSPRAIQKPQPAGAGLVHMAQHVLRLVSGPLCLDPPLTGAGCCLPSWCRSRLTEQLAADVPWVAGIRQGPSP